MCKAKAPDMTPFIAMQAVNIMSQQQQMQQAADLQRQRIEAAKEATSTPETPAEALKTISTDQANARDNTLRRMAQKLSLQRTNQTSPLGLTDQASVARKALLGA